MRLLNKNEYGFTMIELLVVMVIIGILATMSLFALAGSRESARDARRRSDLESIRSALELYRSDCNHYPASITSGLPLVGDGSSGCPATNNYIQEIPDDPLGSGGDYFYSRTTNTTYILCARLEETPATTSCASNSCGSAGNCNYQVANP